MSRVLPFPWYGGKYNWLNFIVENLPQTERYVEPFGGSAVVLLNKEPSPIETYNDIDSGAYNFFKVLRDDREALLDKIDRTPHSREMFYEAQDGDPDDDLERALYFLVRSSQSYNGVQGAGWGNSITVSRREMPQRTAAWNTRREQVERVAERMMEVQIENREATDLIERHDGDDVTFYCDPPYPSEIRVAEDAYRHEMDRDDHCELASVLTECDGYVAISTYRSDLYDDLYDGWDVRTSDEKGLAGQRSGGRTEALYCNYDPDSVA